MKNFFWGNWIGFGVGLGLYLIFSFTLTRPIASALGESIGSDGITLLAFAWKLPLGIVIAAGQSLDKSLNVAPADLYRALLLSAVLAGAYFLAYKIIFRRDGFKQKQSNKPVWVIVNLLISAAFFALLTSIKPRFFIDTASFKVIQAAFKDDASGFVSTYSVQFLVGFIIRVSVLTKRAVDERFLNVGEKLSGQKSVSQILDELRPLYETETLDVHNATVIDETFEKVRKTLAASDTLKQNSNDQQQNVLKDVLKTVCVNAYWGIGNNHIYRGVLSDKGQAYRRIHRITVQKLLDINEIDKIGADNLIQQAEIIERDGG